MDNVFWLNGFPLAPTVNNSLVKIKGNGHLKFNKKGKPYRQQFAKSRTHKSFENACRVWHAMNSRAVMVMRNELLKLKADVEGKGGRFALRIECFFAFTEEQMFTEGWQPDADNRLKPCADALKKILELDDVYFFATLSEKVTTTTKENECSVIRISPMTHRTLDEVRALMFREATA